MGQPDRHLKVVDDDGAPRRSDTELVQAVMRGDARVAEEFYRRVAPRVWAVLRRLLRGNEQDHEDLAQHALEALVTGLDSYRGQAPLEAWAGAVTGHVALDWLRRHQRERTLFEGLSDNALERPSSEKPADRALTNEVLSRIKALLAPLPVDRVTAWLLHDVHGFSLSELAQMTGASVAAAQSRLVRGRSDVHRCLAREPDLAAAIEGFEGGS